MLTCFLQRGVLMYDWSEIALAADQKNDSKAGLTKRGTSSGG